ncbi:Napsin-A [Colletotrichum shisoi]|uniref:Napsin-A n=1 Tax=Colletotrichum shisoi TaxID=2078593 RepID=A0A5Q4BN75_9PEZI|nr:Napsin-A [Colletotrichum shisoi]
MTSFTTSTWPFNGQAIPVRIDTGSGDLFVAANECPTDDDQDGCFGLTSSYIIKTDFGGFLIPDLAISLVYESALREFQNDSFSGIFGLNIRAVGRQLHFNNSLPPMDVLLATEKLREPKFSLSFPRLGDPDSAEVGKLTLGGLGEEAAGHNATYGPVCRTPNYNYDDFPLDRQGWTVHLEGVRVNGVEIKMRAGLLLPDGKYRSMIDSRGSLMYFRPEELDAIAAQFKGPILYPGNRDIYFDCSIPQLMELKCFGEWYAVDPLDLVIPSDHGLVNGTEYCHAALGQWTRMFGDSIIGLPSLRSVFSVFDYISKDLVPQPRVGFASLVDSAAAVARYFDVLPSRLL